MSAKVWNILELAGRLAVKRDDNRTFYLGAIGYRSDGACVNAVNGYPWEVRTPQSHAEARLCRKLDHNAIVYVARINAAGEFAMARPCGDCQRVLSSRDVKRVYYSISPTRYGIYFPNRDVRDIIKYKKQRKNDI